jgi:hypothetical protein
MLELVRGLMAGAPLMFVGISLMVDPGTLVEGVQVGLTRIHEGWFTGWRRPSRAVRPKPISSLAMRVFQGVGFVFTGVGFFLIAAAR